MRILAATLLFLAALSFSGIPELLSGFCDMESNMVSMSDDADAKEKEDSKEKEEKNEKESAKESLLAEDVFLAGLHSGPSLETHNGILRISGYYPEDHYPPPELS